MFVSAEVKDYEISGDEGTITVKGERWLGVVNPDDEENYFDGVFFSLNRKNKYTLDGTLHITKKEFEAETFNVVFFK